MLAAIGRLTHHGGPRVVSAERHVFSDGDGFGTPRGGRELPSHAEARSRREGSRRGDSQVARSGGQQPMRGIGAAASIRSVRCPRRKIVPRGTSVRLLHRLHRTQGRQVTGFKLVAPVTCLQAGRVCGGPFCPLCNELSAATLASSRRQPSPRDAQLSVINDVTNRIPVVLPETAPSAAVAGAGPFATRAWQQTVTLSATRSQAALQRELCP